MEMYADEDARGGVLEPEGIVGIKYRRDRQLETMARLDPTYATLKASLDDTGLSADERSDIKIRMTERETLLLPVYSQIALQFADLHDRAGRMKAKQTIRASLSWPQSRRFFYWRLRRRLNEETLLKKMLAASPMRSSTAESNGDLPPQTATSDSSRQSQRAMALDQLRSWSQIVDFDNNDRQVATWYEENRKTIVNRLEAMKHASIAADVTALVHKDFKSGLQGLKQVLSMMPVVEREAALTYLKD